MASAAIAVTDAVVPAAKAAVATAQGQAIFVYTHLQTRQTLYSLTRSLWNKKALKQMPFAGKKTIPSHIRKDLWQPLCVLSFPNHAQGLDAYHKMREFKTLHETAWTAESMTAKEGPHAGKQLNTRKYRSRAIMDQKANAIADMAAVLFLQEQEPAGSEVKKAEWLNNRPIVKLNSGKTGPAPTRPKYGMGRRPTLGKIEWQGSVKGVKIHWSNVLDAEYAETWPEDVLHGDLQVNRYTAVWPPPDATAGTGVQSAVQGMLASQAPTSDQADLQGREEGAKWWQFGKKSE